MTCYNSLVSFSRDLRGGDLSLKSIAEDLSGHCLVDAGLVSLAVAAHQSSDAAAPLGTSTWMPIID